MCRGVRVLPWQCMLLSGVFDLGIQQTVGFALCHAQLPVGGQLLFVVVLCLPD
jgi:hypothetical protein